MLLIVDKDGNVIPAASLKFGGRIMHAGNNVWRVSQAGNPITNEHVRTVTLPFTVSRHISLTQESVTRMLTATKLRYATIWEATNEYTKEKFRELTKEATNGANGTMESTVTSPVTDFTVTQGIDATQLVTEYLTRAITVTRPISNEVSKAGSTVTNVITRELTVTNPANIIFGVSIYPHQTRGTSFSISVDYYKVTDDGNDCEAYDHTPGQSLTVTQVSNPTGDTLSPTTIDTSGWTEGYKDTDGFVFSGGTGSGIQTLRITDPELGYFVDFDISVNANQSTKSPGALSYYFASDSEYAVDTEGSGDPDDYTPQDSEASASYGWWSMQNDLISSFGSDTSLTSGSSSGSASAYFLKDITQYLYATCEMRGGYVRIYISDDDKENLLATHLRIAATCYNIYGNHGYGTTCWSPYRSRFSLKVKFTESASSFSSGNSLRNMSNPDLSYSFSTIVSKLISQGATAGVAKDIYLSFPKSVIENMSGNYLYAWVIIKQTGTVPYYYPYFRSTTADPTQGGTLYLSVSNVRVELTK